MWQLKHCLHMPSSDEASLRNISSDCALLLLHAGTQKFENLIVGVALILVVVITALFSFWQTVKSTDAMAGFAKMAPQVCAMPVLCSSIVHGVSMFAPARCACG